MADDQGAPDGAGADQGTDAGTQDQGTDNQDLNDQGASDQGTGDQGTDDQGSSDQGSSDDNVGDGQQEASEHYEDFQLTEGMELDKEMLDKAAPIFKELGLNQEGAQKLVNIYSEQVQAQAQAQADGFAQTIEGWENEAKNDKEIGGEQFNENLGIAKTALEKFGTPELNKFLSDSGAGSHPEVVRFLVKLGNLTKEDQPGSGARSANAGSSLVDRLYPNNK